MIVGALAGCSGGGGLPAFDGESPSAARSPVVASDAAISSPTAAAGPLMAFIAGAGDGQTAELDDPSFGGGVSVTVVRTYHAASDRLCRRFVLRNGRGEPSIRAACRNGSRWVAVPFAIP